MFEKAVHDGLLPFSLYQFSMRLVTDDGSSPKSDFIEVGLPEIVPSNYSFVQTKTLLGFPKVRVVGGKTKEIGRAPLGTLIFSWDSINLEDPKINIMQDTCKRFETYLGQLIKIVEKSYS